MAKTKGSGAKIHRMKKSKRNVAGGGRKCTEREGKGGSEAGGRGQEGGKGELEAILSDDLM